MAAGYKIKTLAEAQAALDNKKAIAKEALRIGNLKQFKNATGGAIAREAHRSLALKLASQKQYAPHVEFFRKDADLTHEQIKQAQERQERRRVSKRKSEARANYKVIANARHRINRYINKIKKEYSDIGKTLNFGLDENMLKQQLDAYKRKHLRRIKGKIIRTKNFTPDVKQIRIPRLKSYLDFEGKIKKEFTFGDKDESLKSFGETIASQMIKFMENYSPVGEQEKAMVRDFFNKIRTPGISFYEAFKIFRGDNLGNESNQEVLEVMKRKFGYKSIESLIEAMKSFTWDDIYHGK